MLNALLIAATVVTVWLVLMFSLIVHELGHAATARALGVEVKEISLGAPKLFTIRLGEFRIEVGLIPFIGTTKFPRPITELHWLKIMAITFAGPLASFALAMAAFYLLGGLPLLIEIQKNSFYFLEILRSLLPHSPSVAHMLDTLSGTSTGIPSFLLFITGLLNLVLAIANLVPIPVLDGGVIFFALLEGMIGKKVWYAYAVLAPISLVAIMIYVIVQPFIK